MENERERNAGNDSGDSFQQIQQSTDEALNARIRSEAAARRAEPQFNRREKRVQSTDTSQKKTGGGDQKSTGD